MSRRPPTKLKLYRLTWSDADVARHLGQPRHVVQVNLSGAFPSRAAFIRGMVAAGLTTKQKEDRVASFMEAYAAEPHVVDDSAYFSQPEVAVLVQNPSKIYVSPLNERRGVLPVAWPPERVSTHSGSSNSD